VELCDLPTPLTSQSPKSRSRCLGLFTRGDGRFVVETAKDTRPLSGTAQLVFVSQPATLLPTAALDALPAWWAKGPDPKADPNVADAVEYLDRWAKTLSSSQYVIEDILTNIRGSSLEPAERALGVLFLGALDDVGAMTLCLDRPEPQVRGTVAGRLRAWLVRFLDHSDQLALTFRNTLKWTPAKADRVVELLRPLPPDRSLLAAAVEDRFKELENADIDIRRLAFWELALLFPQGDGKATVEYDPDKPPAGQKESHQKWRAMVMKLIN
jgi:hypothetical protein